MNVLVNPGALSGRVEAICSKSYAHRALVSAALAEGATEIIMNTTSKDIEATLSCIKALGAHYERTDRGVRIFPVENSEKTPLLDCGESGSTARFLMPVAAHICEKATLTGHGRLPERPFDVLTKELRRGGANVEGYSLPISVGGGLKSGIYTLPGDISSQFVSGLMFALPLGDKVSEIRISSPLQSKAYVDMTIQVIKAFGINIEEKENGYTVYPGKYISPGEYIVEGDWSNAAFWLTANAMGSRIQVSGLINESAQGDREILNCFNKDVIDVGQIPDLVPILAVYAASKKGTTRIVNAARLRIKESDRLSSVSAALKNLGGDVEELSDGLIIHGTGALRGGKIHGAGDHRIVMSMAIAAGICTEPVEIVGAEAVEKSYPRFFEDFKMLGGTLDVI